MTKIHDIHGTLQDDDRGRLEREGANQEEIILGIMREHPDHRFAFFEMVTITGFDKDSVKRSLSNLSGSAPEKYADQWGNFPLVYRADRRKKNPASTTSCGTYKVNPVYGSGPAQPHGQADMFGTPQVKHRQGIGL